MDKEKTIVDSIRMMSTHHSREESKSIEDNN